jgi:hypothetical protein
MSAKHNRLKRPLWDYDTTSTLNARTQYVNHPTLAEFVSPETAAPLQQVVRLNWQSTTSDLRDYVPRHGHDVLLLGRPLIGFFPGWDDPREVHAIPEVQALCERIIVSVLLSLLKLNLNDEHDYNPQMIGAAQVWSIAHHCVEKVGASIIYKVIGDYFFAALKRSNREADLILGRVNEETQREGGQ